MEVVDRINQDIDIYLILEKVQEINLLKELLLEKNQYVLFNFAPKQVIILEDQKKIPCRVEIYTSELTDNSISSLPVGQVVKQHSLENKAEIFPSLKAYYQKLYKVIQFLIQQAYDKVNQKDKNTDRVIQLLIEKLGKEIRYIFEVSQLINYDFIDQKLSDRVKNVLRKKLESIRSRSIMQIKNNSEQEFIENLGLYSQESNKIENNGLLQREKPVPKQES